MIQKLRKTDPSSA